MTEKDIRRYCRAVGSYLPCSRRQKRQILWDLRQRLAEYCGEQPNGATLEENFGTPQQVAAGYVDDMDTTELLHALRYRRRVTTIVVAGVLTALIVFVIALGIQMHKFYKSMNGWYTVFVIEETDDNIK